LITIDETAENSIVVVSGANGTVGQSEVDYLETILPMTKVLLLQLEVPLDVVQKAAKIAQERGITVILDPAPAKPLPAVLYPCVDILTPNTTEAAILAGFSVETIKEAEKAADQFLERGVRQAIIKMGAIGAFAKDQAGGCFYPAIPVQAVDTVAAGDAFNGALGAALIEGQPFDKAMRWALAGGAIAVTRAGAQTAMPDRNEIVEILKLRD
jgi:ribokinase